MSAPRQPGKDADSLFELPRMRLGGTGSALCEVCDGVEARCHLGIPVDWITDDEELAWCAAEGIAAALIDPADPPIYESQATYLRRYGDKAGGPSGRTGLGLSKQCSNDGSPKQSRARNFATFGASWPMRKQFDPQLAAFGRSFTHIGELSGRHFDSCGHLRGELVGSRDIALLTKREHGETVYLAIKK